MRLSYSLGSLLTINQILECSKKLNEFKLDTLWIPETWGMENFSMLSLASKENNSVSYTHLTLPTILLV